MVSVECDRRVRNTQRVEGATGQVRGRRGRKSRTEREMQGPKTIRGAETHQAVALTLPGPNSTSGRPDSHFPLCSTRAQAVSAGTKGPERRQTGEQGLSSGDGAVLEGSQAVAPSARGLARSKYKQSGSLNTQSLVETISTKYVSKHGGRLVPVRKLVLIEITVPKAKGQQH